MFDTILSIIAPHHCYDCGKVGTILCESCKYNIISERERACIACQKPTNRDGVCGSCRVPYQKAWFAGIRSGAIAKIVDDYKFNRMFRAKHVVAELFDEILPVLPPNALFVPIPTVRAHVRRRGYDQVLSVVTLLSRKRSIPVERILERKTKTVQRGASARQRQAQAKEAFVCRKKADNEKVYILVDDVYTTGATLKYATKALQAAGAEEVWVVVVARQTLA